MTDVQQKLGEAAARLASSHHSPQTDAENDSGLDGSRRRRANEANGLQAGSPTKSPSKSVRSLPRTPDPGSPSAAQTASAERKKVPMNKVQVGAAPSPNLKAVRSKIGSLDNTTYKPGGGKVKIENRKLDFSKAQPKIAAKNEKYTPSGGDKKIQQVKLQWNAKPKIGSLENAAYKPGGGDKKIETVKLDFKDKAKPKVGSKENAKHVPGGGAVKIETQKIDIKAESKVGSLDNVKHKPGGGEKKIFDDKTYLRQTSSSNVASLSGSGSQATAPKRPNSLIGLSLLEQVDLFDSPQPPPSTPTRSQSPLGSPIPVTPRAVRYSLAKSPDNSGVKKQPSNSEKPKSPKSPKSLRLPKLVASSNVMSADITQETLENKVILPKLK
ncbi:microtubule-associated protein tau isoform X2 [Nasonia vitripennis]|uniref:Microtubule-associated protein n=1 Tax=Nasonia vitripennis TaxID=7425 RepID=A0A7M7Q028_NASVI|nr:microtubule-associated protein tau isoform X2 [Nasonia vitripennis]